MIRIRLWRALLLLIATGIQPVAIQSSDGNELIAHWLKAAQPLWIMPKKPAHPTQPYMLRFAILPRAYTGAAKLEIMFEWPDNHRPDQIIYEVDGSIRDWPAHDYSYRTDNHFEIYLPQLEKGRRAEVLLGWIGAPFDESRAYALLTTDTGQVVQQWVGWKLQ